MEMKKVYIVFTAHTNKNKHLQFTMSVYDGFNEAKKAVDHGTYCQLELEELIETPDKEMGLGCEMELFGSECGGEMSERVKTSCNEFPIICEEILYGRSVETNDGEKTLRIVYEKEVKW